MRISGRAAMKAARAALPRREGLPRPFLRGARILLRPLTRADASGPYAEWFNDPVVCAANSHHVFPHSMKETLTYIEEVQEARDRLVLAIVHQEDGRHLGNIALTHIDPIARSAEFSLIIGETRSWGQGYSKEASRLILDHAFFSLNLARVACGTYASNIPMRRLARFLGMREEGWRRRAAFKQNRWLDVVEFGLLRAEYVRRFGAPRQVLPWGRAMTHVAR